MMFSSKEDALNWFMQGMSNLQKATGMDTEGYEVVLDEPTLCLVTRLQSNNARTLCIVYKVSPQTNVWLVWVPDEGQVNLLPTICDYYTKLNAFNAQVRKPIPPKEKPKVEPDLTELNKEIKKFQEEENIDVEDDGDKEEE